LKIALVLSGQPRFADIAHDLGSLDYKKFDIFLHTWSGDKHPQLAPWIKRENVYLTSIDELIKTYKPVKFSVTSQNEFQNNEIGAKCRDSSEINSIFHMFKSIYLADACRKEYEADNGFSYDVVIRCRFDLLTLSSIPNSKIPDNTIYTPYLLDHKEAPCDWFFISSSPTMSAITDLYLELSNYLDFGIEVSGEALLRHHLKVNGIENSNFSMSAILIRDKKLKDVRFGVVAFADNKKIWSRKLLFFFKMKCRHRLAFLKNKLVGFL
jgi:hypothetical protein